ncbi:MAG: IS5 family transposase [Nitrososphaerota archaeon]|nr:IS5 family transposase [Nitrososphaerota archaeon]
MSAERDWHRYNEALVRRGELNLDSSVMEEWSRELKKANKGKVGEPYRYPESYIRFLAFVRLLFHQPYRQTEGFVHSLSRFVEGLKAPDYSTIDRRVNRLHIDLDESLVKSNDPVSIAVDSSGVKVHNGGDWIRHVWKVKKGYLKVHFAVDVKTGQVVSMDVSSERVGDGRRLKRLVNRARESVRVKRVLADGAYDSKANFNFLAREGIRPVIRVAKNSVPRCNGSYARKKAVIEQQAFKPRAWSRIHRFGYRWRVEGAFSVIKRVFGEYVTARKFVNMAREMAMKASIYNGFIAMA